MFNTCLKHVKANNPKNDREKEGTKYKVLNMCV